MKTSIMPLPEGAAVLRRIALIIGLVVACLAALDVALRLFLPGLPWFRQPIDIQSPEMLYVKLDEIRQFDGIKIVVMGDSLAYGRAMRDHGDKNWKNHTLPFQLQQELQAAYPGCPVLVANLGMNGVLPTDLNQLTRLVSPLKPDLILFDFGLRSFSRDFENASDRETRPWLENLSALDGTYKVAKAEAGIEGWFKDLFVNAWYLYRIKDTIQALIFDGQPVTYVTHMRDALDAWFKNEDTQASGGDDLMLLLKASARYANIDLEKSNPQRQALENILLRLQGIDQAAIAFYATENRENLEDLMDRSHYNELQAQLRGLMSQANKNIEWVGPLSIYEPQHYLDHVHINEEGYRLLVQHLLPKVEKAVYEKKGNEGCREK